MRFPQLIHWSEGQFLQPHHFQQFQKSAIERLNSERDFYLPYKEGLININVDHDSLRSKRVVINSLTALMPDGSSLSMPGNCEIMPLTLDVSSEDLGTGIMVYLAVPFYSKLKPNISEAGSSNLGRFNLSEISVIDENSGDNEIPVVTRFYNARLITDPSKATDCSILPILKLRLENMENKDIRLVIDDKYTPPCVVFDGDNNIFRRIREFVFELKSCKSKILTDIETEGFDPKLVTGSSLLRIMQLQIINLYINTLSNLLIPERVHPLCFYLQISGLLAELRALFPLSDHKDIQAYDHYNLYYVFDDVITSIRTLLSTQGKAECIELEFKYKPEISCMVTDLSDECIIKARDYYLALEGGNNWKDLIEDIETGDNFRLIDEASHEDRVRGVKLSYVRFPPRYLPMPGSDTIYFKVMKDESPRVWRYIVEDHKIAIDYSQNIFKDFKAKLYLVVVDEDK